MIAPQGALRAEYKIAGRRVFIVTHYGRHLDEIAAIRLIAKYATMEFLDKYCQRDELWLGCGGGDFDDHRPEILDADLSDCCATLVARALGVKDCREWHLLRYVLKDDKDGPAVQDTLAKIANRMNRFYMDPRMRRRFMKDPECVTRWAWRALDAKLIERPATHNFEIEKIRSLMDALPYFNATEWYVQARRVMNYEHALFEEGKRDFRKARVEYIPGTDLRIAVVQTDNWQIPAVSRKLEIAVIIIKDSGGNVQIFTNQKFGIMLRYAVQNLRLAEQRAQGSRRPVIDSEVLRSGGYGPDGLWFYHTATEAFMNGSLTNWMPPTALPLDRIAGIVKEGVRFAVSQGLKAKPKRRVALQR